MRVERNLPESGKLPAKSSVSKVEFTAKQILDFLRLSILGLILDFILLFKDFFSELTVAGQQYATLLSYLIFFPKGLLDFKIAWNFSYDNFLSLNYFSEVLLKT